jgi:hypothetical protein
MPSWYELWQADQKKRKKEASQGKINFREASTASRPQYTLPGYQGSSKENSYKWETDSLRNVRGMGRSYNDKFDNITRQEGMSPGQADDYRRSLDFNEDSKQKYKYNKDGSLNQRQNIRAGQGARTVDDLMNGIFKDMYQRMGQSVQENAAQKMQKAKTQAELAKKVTKERPGLVGFLDSTFGRVGNAAHKVFGENFVNAENENYQKLAVDKLKTDPTNKHAIQAIQMLNSTNRAPKNALEKTSDFIGTAAGEVAPYTIGGAYGAAEKGLSLISKLKNINNPIAKDLVRGLMAGTVAGSEKAGLQKVASNEDKTTGDYAKQIGTEALLAGGGDAVLGGVMRNLNLKGQLNQVLKGSTKYNEQDFQTALKEAFAPKGNVSNVVADQAKVIPKPFESKFNLNLPGKSMDSFKMNDIPKVDTPLQLNDWFDFASNGKGVKARGATDKVNLSRGDRELLGKQAENILNRSDTFKNAPEGGFNQRLLDVQKQMQEAMSTVPPKELDGWMKFGQSSKTMPKARFDLSPVEQASSLDPLNRSQQYWQGRYEDFVQHINQNYNPNNLSEESLNELWTHFAKHDEPVTLNQAVDLAYSEGPQTKTSSEQFNPVQRLSELLANKKPIKNTNINDLYAAIKQDGDPASFDELIKLAEMEHNASNAPLDLKNLFRQDPKVKQQVQALNELGGLPKKSTPPVSDQPNVKSLDDMLNLLRDVKKEPGVKLPNGNTLKQPDLGGGNGSGINGVGNSKNPVERLQELLSNTAKQKEASSLPIAPAKSNATKQPLLMSMGGKSKPSAPKVEQSIQVVEKPVVLRTFKPQKDINAMSKEELQNVHKQLAEQHQALSRTKVKTNKQRIQEVQEDMVKVEGLLMKLDLQHFGERTQIPSDQLPDTRAHIESKTEKKPINIKDAADKGYIKTVDNLHRLSRFDQTVEKVLGKNLSASESTHTLGLNSRGSDMISKQILTQDMVNKKGEVVGQSLKKITMQIPKGKLKSFEDYLVNQHAITRMSRGEKVFPDEMKMTTGKSMRIVKNYERNSILNLRI